MNYNAKSKIDKINELESNQKAKAIVESASLQEKDMFAESKQTDKQASKKVYSFSLNPKILVEVEEFLNEFGKKGESKSSFIEDSLRFYLEHRKTQLKEELEQKLKSLQKKG